MEILYEQIETTYDVNQDFFYASNHIIRMKLT